MQLARQGKIDLDALVRGYLPRWHAARQTGRGAPASTDIRLLHLGQKPEAGILLSEGRFRALLKKRSYRYRRPKPDLSHLQDGKAKKKAEKLLEEMKKQPARRFRAPLCGRS